MATRESHSSLAGSSSRLYDTDFYEWCLKTAELLRAGRVNDVDMEHVAEEIEDLGKSQRHALDSRATIILLHLLKIRHQPGRHTRSWDKTIVTQRVAVRALVRNNPSLRRFLDEVSHDVYADAAELAASETGLPRETFPASCPFTAQEIFGEELAPTK